MANLEDLYRWKKILYVKYIEVSCPNPDNDTSYERGSEGATQQAIEGLTPNTAVHREITDGSPLCHRVQPAGQMA